MRKTVPPSERPAVDREHEEILRHIERWLGSELITEAEARTLREFELAHATLPRKRVPVVAEVLAYLGAALALAAGLTLYGDRFDDLSRGGRLIPPAVAALAFLMAGWPIRHHEEAAATRLAGFLWMLTTGAFAGFMAVLLFDVDDPADWSLLVLGASTLALGGTLMVIHPTVATQLGAFAGASMVLPGAIVWWDPPNPQAWVAMSLVALGGLWLALGRAKVVKPTTVAAPLGAIAALYGPLQTIGDTYTGEALLGGVAVAAVFLAVGAAMRSAPVLALAGVGSFGYLFGSIMWFLRDTLGAPLALLLGGATLLLVAVVTLRLGSRARPGPSSPPLPTGR